MRSRVWLTMILLGLWIGLTPTAPALAQDNDRSEREALKERFKQRYPILVELKNAGKVGETHEGYVAAVRSEYLDDRVDPDDEDSRTVREFIGAENRDRRRLYELIAEEVDTSAEKVARRNAIRNFEQAKGYEFLKLQSGEWVRKRDLEDREDDGG